MDNKEKRDAGLPYITDISVLKQQTKNRIRIRRYNKTFPWNYLKRLRILRKILGKNGGNVYFEPPFYCDYGSHIEVGKNCFANYNLVILDVAKVKIGDNVMMGPNVSLYTAGHPLHPQARNSAYEYGVPLTIGNNVWLGGGCIILPGVTIGDNVVIGAGSVVTHDIPNGVVAAGNPCKVIKKIVDSDIEYYFKDRKFDQETLAIIESKTKIPLS